ncbi:MAG: NFACT RNA binding domain-containing protein [Nanoarchaeota archaeon]
MKVVIDSAKTLEENAAAYFELAKKAKKKLVGAKQVVERMRDRKEEIVEKKVQAPKRIVQREWFEKFRWCFAASGQLLVGGRDATTNELVMKKHADQDDLVFHTEIKGSPFMVIKAGGKPISEATRMEAAVFTLCASKAWKAELGGAEVLCVKPDQVTKHANAGEFLTKGAFVIRGETKHLRPALEFAVGVYEEKMMGGPLSAVQANCEKWVRIAPGDGKPSDVARKIKRALGGDLDDIVRVLPSGGCRVVVGDGR